MLGTCAVLLLVSTAGLEKMESRHMQGYEEMLGNLIRNETICGGRFNDDDTPLMIAYVQTKVKKFESDASPEETFRNAWFASQQMGMECWGSFHVPANIGTAEAYNAWMVSMHRTMLEFLQ
jgi:hypothetical protein